jgi:hypothetical protein
MASAYIGLDATRHQFRVLQLYPGAYDDPIVCKLCHRSMNRVPRFEALSYVWGSELSSQQLCLNGSFMPMTANLDVALRRLRPSRDHLGQSKPRTLWVDALCINQQDLDERAAQVRLMQDIFPSARRVLVWLGAAADDSDQAMARISRRDEAQWHTRDFMLQLRHILLRPWFTRTWVLQEFLLANEVIFGCGEHWVSWPDMLAAWKHFDEKMNSRVIEPRFKFPTNFRQRLMATFEPGWTPPHPVNAADEAIIDFFRNMPLLEDLNSNLTSQGERSLEERLSTVTEKSMRLFVDLFRLDDMDGHAVEFTSLDGIAASFRAFPSEWLARTDIQGEYSDEMRSWDIGNLYRNQMANNLGMDLVSLTIAPPVYRFFLEFGRDRIWKEARQMELMDVLTCTTTLQCSDPRDKVYATLGIVGSKARDSIRVDYKGCPLEAYASAMIYIAKHEVLNLRVLRPQILWRAHPFDSPFPSWVPDLSINSLASAQANLILRQERSYGSYVVPAPASIGSNCFGMKWRGLQTGASIDVDRMPLVLSLVGLSLGRVRRVWAFSQDLDIDDYINTINSITLDVEKLCPDSEPLWRTFAPVAFDILSFDDRTESPWRWRTMHERFSDLMQTNLRQGRENNVAEVHSPVQLSNSQRTRDFEVLSERVKGYAFYITDAGFSGLATPDIVVSDILGYVPDMGPFVMRAVQTLKPPSGTVSSNGADGPSARPASLAPKDIRADSTPVPRENKASARGLTGRMKAVAPQSKSGRGNTEPNFSNTVLPRLDSALAYHRIIGICHVRCRDRADFDRQKADGLQDCKSHRCFQGQSTTFNLV